MNKKLVITTPLYYANAAPHVGTAYTTIYANMIANYQRSKHKDVVLVTGTDEHGKKIAESAMVAGVSPQEFVDSNVLSFKEAWNRLEINHDLFVRTTNEQHKTYVTNLFNELLKQGDIYKGIQTGKYCVGCEEYKTVKDLTETGVCPLHPLKELQTFEEENWFFRLSEYEPEINMLIRNGLVSIEPLFYRQEIINFLDSGLRDFSISRKNLSWGIPVPCDPTQSLYVWFDALLGYTSHFEDPNTKVDLHLLGKDILKFHAVYYLGMLVAAGLPAKSKTLLVNGFIVSDKGDDVKIGKSNNNSDSLNLLLDEVTPDALKWWLLKEKQIGHDIKFNKQEIKNVADVDLGDKIGNLVNRLDKLLVKFPVDDPGATARDETMIAFRDGVLEEVVLEFDEHKFSTGLKKIVELAEYCNNQIEVTKPWSLAKTNNDGYKSVVVSLYDCILSIFSVLELVSPTLVKSVTENYCYEQDEGFKCTLKTFNFQNSKIFWTKLNQPNE